MLDSGNCLLFARVEVLEVSEACTVYSREAEDCNLAAAAAVNSPAEAPAAADAAAAAAASPAEAPAARKHPPAK